MKDSKPKISVEMYQKMCQLKALSNAYHALNNEVRSYLTNLYDLGDNYSDSMIDVIETQQGGTIDDVLKLEGWEVEDVWTIKK